MQKMKPSVIPKEVSPAAPIDAFVLMNRKSHHVRDRHENDVGHVPLVSHLLDDARESFKAHPGADISSWDRLLKHIEQVILFTQRNRTSELITVGIPKERIRIEVPDWAKFRIAEDPEARRFSICCWIHRRDIFDN